MAAPIIGPPAFENRIPGRPISVTLPRDGRKGPPRGSRLRAGDTTTETVKVSPAGRGHAAWEDNKVTESGPQRPSMRPPRRLSVMFGADDVDLKPLI